MEEKRASFDTVPERIDEILRKLEHLEERLNQAQEPAAQNNETLDVDGACDYLKIAKSTLYNGVSNGLIPHHKVFNRLVFMRSELEEWVRQESH